MMAAQSTPPPVDEVDLKALIGIVIDNKWLIIVVTAAFFACSLAYALLATPIYQATALVQVEQKVPDLPGLSALSQTLGASNSQATTEIAIITSRSVIGQAVDNLNLNVTVEPHRFPLIGDFIARRYSRAAQDNPGLVAAPRFGVNSDDWGGSMLDIAQLDVPRSLLGQHLTLIAEEHHAYSLLDADDKVLLQGMVGETAKGHGITLQVKALTANPGMRFDVRRNSDLLTISQLQHNIHASEQGKDSGIIELTYDNADPSRASDVLDQIAQAYVRQNVDQNAAQAANSLEFVKGQLPLMRDRLERAQDALNTFQMKVRSVDISLQTKGLLDQIVAVEGSIQQLDLQKASVESRYTKDHPAYQVLTQQIHQLQGQKDDLEKQVDNLPDTQRDLLRLTEDVQVSNVTYTNLLQQDQQLEIARAGKVGNVRIVDKAAVDIAAPVSPKKSAIIASSTLFGTFLSGVFIFLRQKLKRGIEDPAEIEQLVGLPVYASIPLSDKEQYPLLTPRSRNEDGELHLLALSAPSDLTIESLRSLRTSLHFARLEAKNNILMICGSSPGAGKTFVSANLAAIIAQTGKRVLLIDADMRRGTVHRMMGARVENGLSELIAGQIDLATAIRPVHQQQELHFISRGNQPPNPSELLMSSGFTALLERVLPLYDLIIIDTPPILAVTDAAVIGHHAGTSLLVVRFGLNQVQEVTLAKQRFEQNGVEIKGAIFNAVEKRSSGYYSYGYYDYKKA
jgi:tyrosine-protein kinase Etk/Wzc